MGPPPAILRAPAHRIPTLWALYRPLLRAATAAPLPHPHRRALRKHVRDEFRLSRNLGNLDRIRARLRDAEQLLHDLDCAPHSHSHLSRLRALASHLVSRPRPRPPTPPLPPSSTCIHRKPTPRPSILHATHFHPPLVRTRPQPLALSMLIFRRRQAAQKRFDRLAQARELERVARDVEREEGELGMLRGASGQGQSGGELTRREPAGEQGEGERWGDEWRGWIREAREKELTEQRRNELRIPPDLFRRASALNRQRERNSAEAALRRKQKKGREAAQGQPGAAGRAGGEAGQRTIRRP
ncbi:hypothetical protein Rhopal_007228-T1 [Rhodotorula paludigena]|uniref:Complex 1 LYR protein domain-containing protein n=1 Tax=Rhodotorula paludigena TaxID=86838 RepID=A0AAV5GW04_9BASI|nr:hypothetical protein Rhopal_007228-T1 [Rhodotorula paludigena]